MPSPASNVSDVGCKCPATRSQRHATSSDSTEVTNICKLILSQLKVGSQLIQRIKTSTIRPARLRRVFVRANLWDRAKTPRSHASDSVDAFQHVCIPTSGISLKSPHLLTKERILCSQAVSRPWREVREPVTAVECMHEFAHMHALKHNQLTHHIDTHKHSCMVECVMVSNSTTTSAQSG